MTMAPHELLAKAQAELSEQADFMIPAIAADMAWLVAQLACWPARVDETRTTNISFLMKSAAATMIAEAVSAPADAAQRLQDHMEQFHGVCLRASEWDAAVSETMLMRGVSAKIDAGLDGPDGVGMADAAAIYNAMTLSDSVRLPKGGDGTAPCEASQSGAAKTAHRPDTDTPKTPPRQA